MQDGGRYRISTENGIDSLWACDIKVGIRPFAPRTLPSGLIGMRSAQSDYGPCSSCLDILAYL